MRSLHVTSVFLLAVTPLLSQQEAPDFQREVRPILSENCFHCHGPDKSTRMVNLRLDTREGAFSARATGKVIEPGNAESSLLYKRINHEKPAMRMPPAASKKTLTEQQREVLRRWIDSGAEWKEHWAFQPPIRHTPPVVNGKSWPRNAIDNFILARLERANLAPAPEADRRRLIRRVSLDVTGLPPSPEIVEAALSDTAADWYEKLVDRLLASPRYGEHRARYWLDAARYADSHGIHIDNYREMWPYRDWVINAFNRNLSFDRFTIEQLAGDLLPNATRDQQTATGFHRCNPTTNEAGSIPEEVDAMYAKDRVETTGTVWLGLTLGCASCHDHKFDPLGQKEFYQFAAFFRNITQDAMDGNIPDTPPVVVLPKGNDASRWEELRAEAANLRGRLAEKRKAAAADPTNALLVPESELIAVTASQPQGWPKGVSLGEGPDKHTRGLHFSGGAKYEVPGGPRFDGTQPFSVSAWVYIRGSEENYTVISQATELKLDPADEREYMPPNFVGWRLEVIRAVPIFSLLAAKKGINVQGSIVDRLEPNKWSHLTATYDGSGGQTGLRLYVNGKAVPNLNDGVRNNVVLGGDIRNDAPMLLGGAAVADLRLFNRTLRRDEARILADWSTLRSAMAKPAREWTADERDAIANYRLNRLDSDFQKMAQRLEAVEFELREIRRRSPVSHVMQEKMDAPPMANVLFRGQYDQPRETVKPDVPSILPPMQASLARNRLGLAQWLVDPANPLTARVQVNRFWQEIFGTGLVKTTEDFGSQGEPPSHPELLDWLAVEFRESGWDVKKLIRLMVTSAAYKQSARVTPEKLNGDPDNRLLSRGPRFRMDGEMVRDLALGVSELLRPNVGGPSVKPYQPEGVWEAVAMRVGNTTKYVQDHGDALYRRSLYTFWKRAAPPASMEIFNAPTRENCTVRRERTNTPLQALVTLNDPQFVEASRHLAERAMKNGKDADTRLDYITSRVIARPLEQREREAVKKALKDLLAYYDARPAQAEKLVNTGESKRDPAMPAVELAVWTLVASDVLNLDEALNK